MRTGARLASAPDANHVSPPEATRSASRFSFRAVSTSFAPASASSTGVVCHPRAAFTTWS